MDKLEGKKNYSEFPEMTHNPFGIQLVSDMPFKWIKVGKSSDSAISMSSYTNEQTGVSLNMKEINGRFFYKEEIVDKGKFIKVYKNYLKDMFSLSSTALKLFGYFVGKLGYKDNTDIVYMNLQDGIDFCQYGDNSRSLIYRGLVELISKGFICKTDRQWLFYVNPKYAFNGGNRVDLLFSCILNNDSDNADESKSHEIENW
jgi:hypothetical protein